MGVSQAGTHEQRGVGSPRADHQFAGPAAAPADQFHLTDLQSRVHRDNKRGYLPASGNKSVAMVLLEEPGRVVNFEQHVPLTSVPADVLQHSLEMLGKSWISYPPSRKPMDVRSLNKPQPCQQT